MVNQADRTVVSERVQQAIRNDLAFDIVYHIVRSDGSIRWAPQSIATPVMSGNVTVVEVVDTLHDITDRKLAQEALGKVKGDTGLLWKVKPN